MALKIAFFSLVVAATVIGIVVIYKWQERDLMDFIKHWHQDRWRQPLLNAGVPEDEIECCMRWAFGDEWATMPLKDTDEEWNNRHSDIFILHGYDEIYEAFYRIGKAYLEVSNGEEENQKTEKD